MIVSKTPLRISFFGGGTDFREFYREHGGAVLSTAIDKYIYVMLNPKYDNRVRVSYSHTENVECVCEIQHDIIRTALEMFGIERGIEVVTVADVPGGGTGLGSSSALAVGMVNALSAWRDREASRLQLAHTACHIEIDRLRKPIGEQDQYASAFGDVRLYEWDTSGWVEEYTLEEEHADKTTALNHSILLLDTGITRGADDILSAQRDNIPTKAVILNELQAMAVDAFDMLKRNNYRVFGEYLHESWKLKQTLANGISNPEIDTLYQKALDAGAWGGKICGAGGGGFLLLCAPPDKHEAIRVATGLREMKIRIGVEGSAVRVI